MEEQEIDEQNMSLVEGCERTLTRREYRCLLAHKEAWEKGQSSVAVAELFSPPRFSKVLEQRGEQGLAYDIKQGWDLTNSRHRTSWTSSWVKQNRSCWFAVRSASIGEAGIDSIVTSCQSFNSCTINDRLGHKQNFVPNRSENNSSEEAECYWNTHGPVICGSIPQFRSCCRVAG